MAQYIFVGRQIQQKQYYFTKIYLIDRLKILNQPICLVQKLLNAGYELIIQLFLMSPPRKYQLFGVTIFMNFLSAWYETCFGPIIPYYSAATGIDETDYSYLFMVKSAANLVAGIVLSFIIDKLSTQKLFIICMLTSMVSLTLSTFSLTTLNLTMTIFFATLTTICLSDIAFLVTIKLFLDDQPEYWVQVLEFFFVVGALGGQLFVVIFQIKSLMVLGLAFVIPMIGILIWPVPDVTQEGEQQGTGLTVSNKSRIYITLVFFFFATIDLAIASWMPTYSIKAGVADVKGSALFSSLFWIPSFFAKIMWIYLPGSIEKKLGLSLKLVLVSAILALIFQQLQMIKLVCFFTPISIGITIAGVFGFLLSWVVDNGFAFRPQDNIIFLLGHSLGEGLLITPMGYMMGIYGFKALIIIITFCSLCLLVLFLLAVSSMQEDKNQYQILYPQQRSHRNIN